MTPFFSSFKKPIFQDLFILFVLATTLFGAFLGSRPLANPDEGRYVEIPREMLLTHDFITPRLNGIKYFEKPVLFYWMEALSLKAFGINEWAARLVPMILALVGVLSIYLMGQFLFSRKTGFYAALTLMTSALYFALAHIVILDMALTTFLSLGLLSFLTGFYTPVSLKRRLCMYGASFFLGLSFLTKGVVTLALAGPIIVIWLTFYKLWRKLWPLYLPTSLFIFLLTVLPWHILVSLENPEFLWFYFVHEHFLRYTTTLHSRSQPLWFFLPCLIIGLFPWIFYAFQTLKKIGKTLLKEGFLNEKEGFLLIWTVFTFLFFSISNSKLIPYILPVFPSLSLLIGVFLQTKIQEKISLEYKVYIGLLFLLTCGLIGLSFFTSVISESLTPYIPFGIFFLWNGIFLGPLLIKITRFRRLLPEIIIIFMGTFIFYIFIASLGSLIPYQTTKSIAFTIQEKIPSSTEIITLKTYPPDLAIYLNLPHPIPVFDSVGELKFGISQESTPWVAPLSEFSKKWSSSQKVCAVIKKNALQSFEEMNLPKKLIPLLPKIQLPNCAASSHYVLICNH
ncbi:MAG: phospholipid carrier-dependent glycosyltransferase [Proteobacteria bacterium]|nr:phospholipid carrier-dependent glycosyltransferase [Pseudomonadota bacterium]